MSFHKILAVVSALSFFSCSVYAAPSGQNESNASFNPAISLVLSGRYASFSEDPDNYSINGISLGEETSPGVEGFSIGESELVMSSNINDRLFGRFTIALTPENTIEIEEAFIQTVGLEAGWAIKAGRMFSDIGYHNSKHFHSWDFVDSPLVYRALLANRLLDDGLQFTWLAPTENYIEIGVELLRGDSYPAGGSADQGTGTKTFFARTGGDVGSSHSWRAGLSYVQAASENRESGDENTPDVFTGDSTINGLDFVWKWAQDGDLTKKNATFIFEYLQRNESGAFDPAGSGAVPYTGLQTGWYAQAVYGFRPHWRTGLRYDWLETDNTGALSNGGHTSTRTSVMIDYARNEFSRLRLQYNHDLSSPGVDHQVYVQYVMSFGAHGAHRF